MILSALLPAKERAHLQRVEVVLIWVNLTKQLAFTKNLP